jgi:glycosyltransferase involved in cell wall biosynthesis
MKNNQKDTSPLITVAMPIYNAGEYLLEAVNSIIAQTYTNWELYVIDDGSTDSAIDSIKLIKDERIKILQDGLNKGLAARLNQAIDLAKGQYFARMDQDDISVPERFKMQIDALEANSSLDLVATRALTINSKNKVIGQLPFASTHKQICAKPWLGFYMPHPTWMGKLIWFKKYKYKVPQSYYSEDCELLLRSYESSSFACLPEVLFKYRIKDRINWKSQIRARKAVLKLQSSHFYNQRQYLSMALSLLAFTLKVTLDFLKVVKQLLSKV